MNSSTIRANMTLLLTAAIWGFAFVAQRVGMDHIGPMLFNAIRFALGVVSLLPLLFVRGGGATVSTPSGEIKSGVEDYNAGDTAEAVSDGSSRTGILGSLTGTGLLAGLFLFAGSTFQQIGIVYTSAGNAGFITGMYIIIVPILGILWGQRAGLFTWVAAIVSLFGLYLLSIGAGFSMGLGDALVLVSALFWAFHVHIIGLAAGRHSSVKLSIVQYSVVSIVSFIWALIAEPIEPSAVVSAMPAILYGGIMSVGVAYTLQIIGQRHAAPAHAAIILSLEGAFAAVGGWLLLGEVLSMRQLFGAVLMLAAMFIAQIPQKKSRPADRDE